jgi:cell division protein FtsL
MLRSLVLLALAAAVVSAVSLYAIGHKTRQLSDRTTDMAREIRDLEREIAVLRAERAFLLRPARIEPIARGEMNMRPITGEQFTTTEALNRARAR